MVMLNLRICLSVRTFYMYNNYSVTVDYIYIHLNVPDIGPSEIYIAIGNLYMKLGMLQALQRTSTCHSLIVL